MRKYLFFDDRLIIYRYFFALIRHQYTVAEIFLYFCSSNDTTRRGTLFASHAR